MSQLRRDFIYTQKSEENEASAASQNEPIKTKDKFAYQKTSKSDKEHVKGIEDEDIVKNKIVYWKKRKLVSNR